MSVREGNEFHADLVGGGAVDAIYDPDSNTITTVFILGLGDVDFSWQFGQLVEEFDVDNQ